MIAYDFSSESKRVRTNYYNLLSPAGRAAIAALLMKEQEILNNFVLSYETPELRRLEAKSRKTKLTDEEKKLLKKGKKSFKGLLASGDMIQGEKALQVARDYLDCLDIVEEDLKTLSSFATTEVQQNSEIILGKQMSYWNLHPDQFPVSVYQSIFDSPEYTKQEIEKLFRMKLGAEINTLPPKVFSSIKEVEQVLNNYIGTPAEKHDLTEKLLELRVIGDFGINEFQHNVVRIINTLLEKDAEFDYEVYEELKHVLPQYHNKKTRYFIYLLSQYNTIQTVPVSSRIDFTTLHGFYRKADELCSS